LRASRHRAASELATRAIQERRALGAPSSRTAPTLPLRSQRARARRKRRRGETAAERPSFIPPAPASDSHPKDADDPLRMISTGAPASRTRHGLASSLAREAQGL
jgi:hypothetical protein